MGMTGGAVGFEGTATCADHIRRGKLFRRCDGTLGECRQVGNTFLTAEFEHKQASTVGRIVTALHRTAYGNSDILLSIDQVGNGARENGCLSVE